MGRDRPEVTTELQVVALKGPHGRRAALAFPTATSGPRSLRPDPASPALPASVPSCSYWSGPLMPSTGLRHSWTQRPDAATGPPCGHWPRCPPGALSSEFSLELTGVQSGSGPGGLLRRGGGSFF